MAITEDDLTQEIFETYGMTSFPPMEAFAQLESETPELLIWSADTVQIKTGLFKTEVYWAFSGNNSTWYVYKDSTLKQVSLSDFYKEEMTTAEISALSEDVIAQVATSGKIYFRVCLITNTEGEITTVSSLNLTADTSFDKGQDYIFTGENLVINTKHWVGINNAVVSASIPEGTDVRFAFANSSSSWKVWKNTGWVSLSSISEIYTKGMTKAEVEALKSGHWSSLLLDQLRLAVALKSNTVRATPKVYYVHFNYDAYENPTYSNTVSIPIPSLEYKRYMISPEDYKYTLIDIEGIGFANAQDYSDFYTTPNKIQLKAFNIGTLVGSRQSDVFKVVIVNTYDAKNFRITLRMRMSNDTPAATYPDHCLFTHIQTLSGKKTSL